MWQITYHTYLDIMSFISKMVSWPNVMHSLFHHLYDLLCELGAMPWDLSGSLEHVCFKRTLLLIAALFWCIDVLTDMWKDFFGVYDHCSGFNYLKKIASKSVYWCCKIYKTIKSDSSTEIIVMSWTNWKWSWS